MQYKEFLKLKSVRVDSADLEVIDFGRTMNNAARTVLQFLFTEKELSDFLATVHPVRLDVCKVTGTTLGDLSLRQQTILSERAWYVPELRVGDMHNKGLVGYQMDTAKGMCGAPLMASAPRHYKGHCLLGIHVAGTLRSWDKEGYAVPLTHEAAQEALRKLGIFKCNFEQDLADRGIALEVPDAETQAGLELAGLVAGSFELLGEVQESVNISPVTKLKPTFMGEEQVFGDCEQRQAHLRPALDAEGVLRYPMVEGLRNYQTPVTYDGDPDLDMYVDLATQRFREKSVHDFRGLLTFEEACTTREGLKLKPINKTTSPGYPYSLHTTQGKKAFFGAGDTFEYTSEECVALRDRVDHVIDMAKNGVRLAHVCTDFLKDEVRPHAKVDAVQSRVISGSPLDYVVACRVYFGAFMAACFRHNIETGLAPGINPYCDWWRVANHLLGSNRTKCFDGDFKRFDASQQPYILWAILDFINRWYDDGEENAQVRRVLWMDLVHSRHLTGIGSQLKYIVQWNKSLPSGHPLTTIVNSLFSLTTLTFSNW
jgi:hypothetical protein